MADKSTQVLREPSEGVVIALGSGQLSADMYADSEDDHTLKPWMKQSSKVLCMVPHCQSDTLLWVGVDGNSIARG